MLESTIGHDDEMVCNGDIAILNILYPSISHSFFAIK